MEKHSARLKEDNDNHRLEHQKLAALIKGVHKHLRRKFRENDCDYEAVWESHSHDSVTLKSYADAMKQLSTDHWSEYPESRIDWCYRVITEYFLTGGLQRALEKDAKHKFFEMQRNKEEFIGSSGMPKTVDELQGQSSSASSAAPILNNQPCDRYCHDATSQKHLGCCPSEHLNDPTPDAATSPTTPQPRPIRLLDVGSCYNPFKDYPHLESVAVDLYPAHSSVLQCDFIHLDVIPSSPCSTHDKDGSNTSLCQGHDKNSHNTSCRYQEADVNNPPIRHGRGEDSPDTPTSLHRLLQQDPIRQLPMYSFDVVVCCLLLEYLPSPVHRALCCIKAVRLLKMNGLLLIVTPDSKSSYRNAPMMKSWRTAMEALGMSRWKYHKMTHLHCMAFRKVSACECDALDTIKNQMSPLLYIPQDFTDACYDDVDKPKMDEQEEQVRLKAVQENEDFRSSVAGELPIFCGDLD